LATISSVHPTIALINKTEKSGGNVPGNFSQFLQ
jgi:hypothetical protein